MTETFENIALHALIGTPDLYDGQPVRVVGLCSFRFEGNAMWAAQEYRDSRITKNAVWLSVGRNPELLPFDGHVMLVEGVFSAQNNGHLGLYSGAIEQISRIEPWER
jgi:hypothetical protein